MSLLNYTHSQSIEFTNSRFSHYGPFAIKINQNQIITDNKKSLYFRIHGTPIIMSSNCVVKKLS